MKKHLRARFRGLRKSIELEVRIRAEKALIDQLEEFSKEFDFVASFSSYGSEIDLSAINRKLASQNRLLLPRRCGEDLHFYWLGSGKAFYDRFLEKHPEIFSVGIGFRSQLALDPLPRELWDCPVNKLILV